LGSPLKVKHKVAVLKPWVSTRILTSVKILVANSNVPRGALGDSMISSASKVTAWSNIMISSWFNVFFIIARNGSAVKCLAKVAQLIFEFLKVFGDVAAHGDVLIVITIAVINDVVKCLIDSSQKLRLIVGSFE
jgi:hypothetical protein